MCKLWIQGLYLHASARTSTTSGSLMSASKAKGTYAETAVVNYLKDKWDRKYVERRTLSGQHDRGDIAGIPGVVIEVKNEKTIKLSEWLKEAQVECDNDSALVGAVWHKKRGTTDPGKWYVTMDGETFAYLLKAAGF